MIVPSRTVYKLGVLKQLKIDVRIVSLQNHDKIYVEPILIVCNDKIIFINDTHCRSKKGRYEIIAQYSSVAQGWRVLLSNPAVSYEEKFSDKIFTIPNIKPLEFVIENDTEGISILCEVTSIGDLNAWVATCCEVLLS